jgi:hypothetical protein
MARARTKQISVTVDAEVLAEVERRLRSQAESLSAWVSNALAEEIRRQNLRAALEAFERRHGAVTAEEMASARASLEAATRRTKRMAKKRRPAA